MAESDSAKAQIEFALAQEDDLDAICAMVKSAVALMQEKNIFQWDDIYPAREDFAADIKNGHLYVGKVFGDVAVIFAVNKEFDEEYKNGKWKYSESDFRVVHRLCVNPKYQNRGIAKSALSYIETKLCNEGVESIRMDTFCKNPIALSLYLKAGYKEVGFAEWSKGRFVLLEKGLQKLT